MIQANPRESPIAPQHRPSDRVYALFGWTLLCLMAALLVYGGWIAPHYPVGRPLRFRLVILTILLFNALWWAIADRRFARFIRSSGRSRALRLITALYCVALNVPILQMLFAGRMPGWLVSAPYSYAAAVTLWHLGLVAWMPIIASARLIVLAGCALARCLREAVRGSRIPRLEDESSVDLGRRALLGTAVAGVPMVLLGAGAAASSAQERSLLVHRHRLPAPWLPDRLRGLTITHVSDLHVGRHYRPYRLRRLVDEVNRLDSDLVVITGDIVDVSNDMLPPAMEALKRVEHRHGLFVCIGNHDEIDNRAEFITGVREHLPLLINDRRSLQIGGERLAIAGLDYDRHDAPSPNRAGNIRNINTMLAGYDRSQEGPVITLAHHPHAFDRLAERDVPLTLSGHTHGGQLMLTTPGARLELGAGSLLFRYIRGFYRRTGRTLFVNSGVGNWFPLRIHAPAEIVRIRLV